MKYLNLAIAYITFFLYKQNLPNIIPSLGHCFLVPSHGTV